MTERVPNPQRRIFLKQTAEAAWGVGALALASALPTGADAQEALTETSRVFGADGLTIRHSKNRRCVETSGGISAEPVAGVPELFRARVENKTVFFIYDPRQEGWYICSKDGKTIGDIRTEVSARAGFEILDLSFDTPMIQARLPLPIQNLIGVELMRMRAVHVTNGGEWEFILRAGRERLTLSAFISHVEAQTTKLRSAYADVSALYERAAKARIPAQLLTFADDVNTAALKHREGAKDGSELKETHRALFTALRNLSYHVISPAVDAYSRQRPERSAGSSRESGDIFLVDHGLIPNIALRITDVRPDKIFLRKTREEMITIGNNPVLTDLFEGLAIADMQVRTVYFNEPDSQVGGTRLNGIGILINEGAGIPIDVIRNNELVHEVLDRLVPNGMGISLGTNPFADFEIAIADPSHANDFLSDVASLAARSDYAREEVKRIIQVSTSPANERPPAYELTLTICEGAVRNHMEERGIAGDIVEAVGKLPEEDIVSIVALYRDIGKRLVEHMKAKGMFRER